MGEGNEGRSAASAAFWERYYAAAPPKPAGSPDAPRAHQARLPYLPGLDGIRAIAVVAVILYHASGRWLPGGYLGVGVFFVLSGYLITSLLIAERRATGGVDLKRFWIRRARRLLPAVYVLLVASLGYAIVVLPDEVARLRGDALAAVAYVTNWYLVLHQESYFDAIGRPSLFRHLWSLAVEEQFYLLWPLVFVAATRFLRRRYLAPAVIATAALSSGLMAYLYQPGVDPSRIYYGTDTRAAELLAGAALAFLWQPARVRLAKVATSRYRALLPDAIGLAALLALFVFYWRLGEFDPRLYRGGFALVALATAVLIAACVHPGARIIARALEWRPLRWLGLRSYSIYLWHWPVFMVTRPYQDVALDGWRLLALRLAITLLLAEFSYRCVETPFRRGQVGRAWRTLRQREVAWYRAAPAWASVAAVAAAALVAVGAARARPASPPPYLVVGGIHTEFPTATPTAAATATPTAAWPASPTPTTTATADPADVPMLPIDPEPSEPSPTSTPTPTPTPVATASTPAIAALRVTAIGDSVMLGAAPKLQEAIPNLSIDAELGMQVGDVIDILRTRRDAGSLGDVVVIHFGDNGLLTTGNIDEIMGLLADVRRVVLVTVKVPRAWEGPNNALLAEAANRYPNATLVDWHAASAGRPDLFWDDGIHLRPEGAEFYASLIVDAIDAAAE